VACRSVEDAALICGHHILYVDEGVFSAMCLERLKRLLNLISDIHLFPLRVIDLVAHVLVRCFVEVQDGQDLTVVGHQGLTDGVGALDESLEDLECDVDDFSVAGVQCS